MSLAQIDIIEAMIREKDREYVSTVKAQDLSGEEVRNIQDEERSFLDRVEQQKKGDAKPGKSPWNKSTKLSSNKPDLRSHKQRSKGSQHSQIFMLGPSKDEPEYFERREVIRRANAIKHLQAKKQMMEVHERPYLSPENMNKETFQKVR